MKIERKVLNIMGMVLILIIFVVCTGISCVSKYNSDQEKLKHDQELQAELVDYNTFSKLSYSRFFTFLEPASIYGVNSENKIKYSIRASKEYKCLLVNIDITLLIPDYPSITINKSIERITPDSNVIIYEGSVSSLVKSKLLSGDYTLKINSISGYYAPKDAGK